MEYQNTEEQSETDRSVEEGDNLYADSVPNKRKNSFVWKYFRSIGDRNCECIICKACVGNQTSNLARHLLASHNIIRQGSVQSTRGRPSRSFIWKYCTKEDSTHARCHLCNKLLYCGGGNTSNITKHLRRKHQEDLSDRRVGTGDVTNNTEIMDESKETIQAIAAIDYEAEGGNKTLTSSTTPLVVKRESVHNSSSSERKDRKGGSYVWNYCDKLSRHTIRCKLCNKTMSFHGTANIITHLQRRHNIVGKIDNESKTSVDANDTEENYNAEHLEESSYDGRRRSAASSIVWKYCQRVGPDIVRCSFCKKNLSYQGTSNLQRHLHRMHGVVTQGRSIRYDDGEAADDGQQHFDRNFIWEHCIKTDGRIKCKMCNAHFDSSDMAQVHKHLSVTHAVKAQKSVVKRPKRRRVSADATSDEYMDYDEPHNWSARDDDAGYVVEFSASTIKKDDSLFGDIIEEDEQGREDNDEDPFDPSHFQEYPVANPLSPQSSRGGSPDPRIQSEQYGNNNKKLRKLNEDRMRVETEYFREKAGYYRMLKYLTALQAKKVRNELEQMKNSNMNGVGYELGQHNDVPPAQQEEFIK